MKNAFRPLARPSSPNPQLGASVPGHIYNAMIADPSLCDSGHDLWEKEMPRMPLRQSIITTSCKP